MPVKPLGMTERLSPRAKPKLTVDDLQAVKDEQALKAKYKIEVIFSRHRSSLAYKPSPCMILIWESGKRFHGGGDQKMYWCGYNDCGKPMSSDNFAYMHVVCPHCQKELFLDPDAKKSHVDAVHQQRGDTSKFKNMPLVVGERMANLTPPKLAELLEKLWHQLDGDADIYLKYSPYEIRYDPKEESTKTMDNLDKVRIQRQPLIYTLKNILKDIGTGAGLRNRIQAMITS